MSFPRYERYKGSEVEWLGEVPEHWRVDRLHATVNRCNNGVWGDEEAGDEWDLPCVRVADFDRDKLTVKKAIPTIRNVPEGDRRGRMLRNGDLLLEKSGGGDLQPVGCVVLYDNDLEAVCSNFIACMKLAPGINASYCRYLHTALYALRLTTRSINQTSGIQNLDQYSYLSELVALPEYQEQVSIALFLESETAKIDALIEEQRRLIELLKEKRQAVISHAVTKGLNPDAEMKDSRVTWLGKIPTHWEVRTVSSLSTKITNGFVGPTRDIYVERGVRYLQSLHIKNKHIMANNAYFVSEEWSASNAKSILKTGDVLIVQTGDVGQSAVVTEEFEGSNCHALIIVSPVKGLLDGEWLSTVTASDYGFQTLLSIQTGALHPHLNCGDVKDVLCPLPPLAEQHEIVSYLRNAQGNFDDLIASAESSTLLLQERRSALIAAAVTGKIDVRNYAKQSTGEAA